MRCLFRTLWLSLQALTRWWNIHSIFPFCLSVRSDFCNSAIHRNFQVIQLLNTAQLASSVDSTKLDNLRKVQEIIVNREPDLLDNFLDEVLAFQTDRSQDVRKFVVGFIEDACKKDTAAVEGTPAAEGTHLQ